MQQTGWSVGALAGAAAVWLAVSSATPAAPALVGRQIGSDVWALESRVNRDPTDAAALAALTEAYLAHGAPGLAQAAIDRAPPEIREIPVIADARARSLSELGLARFALDVQRGVLAACRERDCPLTLMGRAQRRERVLAELVRLGVDDPKTNPNLALVAYRRTTREVTLDLP